MKHSLKKLSRKSDSEGSGLILAAGVEGSSDPKIVISQLEDKIIGLERQLFQNTHTADTQASEKNTAASSETRNDADKLADKLINEAKQKAEQLLSGVKKRVSTIESEARKKAGEIIAEAEKTLENAKKESAKILSGAAKSAAPQAVQPAAAPVSAAVSVNNEEYIAKLDEAVQVLQRAFTVYGGSGVSHAEIFSASAGVPTAKPFEEGDAFFDKYAAAVSAENKTALPAMGIIGDNEAVDEIKAETAEENIEHTTAEPPRDSAENSLFLDDAPAPRTVPEKTPAKTFDDIPLPRLSAAKPSDKLNTLFKPDTPAETPEPPKPKAPRAAHKKALFTDETADDTEPQAEIKTEPKTEKNEKKSEQKTEAEIELPRPQHDTSLPPMDLDQSYSDFDDGDNTDSLETFNFDTVLRQYNGAQTSESDDMSFIEESFDGDSLDVTDNSPFFETDYDNTEKEKKPGSKTEVDFAELELAFENPVPDAKTAAPKLEPANAARETAQTDMFADLKMLEADIDMLDIPEEPKPQAAAAKVEPGNTDDLKALETMFNNDFGDDLDLNALMSSAPEDVLKGDDLAPPDKSVPEPKGSDIDDFSLMEIYDPNAKQTFAVNPENADSPVADFSFEDSLNSQFSDMLSETADLSGGEAFADLGSFSGGSAQTGGEIDGDIEMADLLL